MFYGAPPSLLLFSGYFRPLCITSLHLPFHSHIKHLNVQPATSSGDITSCSQSCTKIFQTQLREQVGVWGLFSVSTVIKQWPVSHQSVHSTAWATTKLWQLSYCSTLQPRGGKWLEAPAGTLHLRLILTRTFIIVLSRMCKCRFTCRVHIWDRKQLGILLWRLCFSSSSACKRSILTTAGSPPLRAASHCCSSACHL